MYGDDSFGGRAISLLVRASVLSFRAVGVLLWTFCAVALAVLYLVLLPVATVGFVVHLIGILS